MNKLLENNQVTLVGEIKTEFEFSHEVYGKKFYRFELSVERFSGTKDVLPVVVSERLIDVTKDYRGLFMEASGQFRSYNRHEENHNRLVLSMFVRDLHIDETEQEVEKPNYIFLDGYLCKPPVYRKTPLGREIADLLMAVNRPYGKSDYSPCICWGRNARYADGFGVGEHVQLWGRIQSREYQKQVGDDEYETRVAYEISVSKLECVEESNEITAACVIDEEDKKE